MLPSTVHESHLAGATLNDLGLSIAGTRLESILVMFREELQQVGLAVLDPQFYLATEWGVPFPSTSIAIPFYLACPDLTAYHANKTGLIEGKSDADILRYLRHEMGHVVNYAYRLYDTEAWTAAFGPFSRPYPEEYTPRPFSREFVHHLPGHYAQKHPDEDWAETFAVWMTPNRDWRREYAGWPVALGKLEYCARVMAEFAGQPSQIEPIQATDDSEEEWDEFAVTLSDFYGIEPELAELPGLDGALRIAFEDATPDRDAGGDAKQIPISDLIQRVETELTTNVFRWTGHFPERTRPLLRLLAKRSDSLNQVYRADREIAATLTLTALVTSLAMNYVYRGDYFPAASE